MYIGDNHQTKRCLQHTRCLSCNRNTLASHFQLVLLQLENEQFSPTSFTCALEDMLTYHHKHKYHSHRCPSLNHLHKVYYIWLGIDACTRTVGYWAACKPNRGHTEMGTFWLRSQRIRTWDIGYRPTLSRCCRLNRTGRPVSTPLTYNEAET